MAEGEVKHATLVILRSADGRGGWEPVKAEDVPEWVKAPDNMAHLVAGQSCMKCDEGEKGSDWYCARTPEKAARMLVAQHKRARKARARVAQLHRQTVALRAVVRH